MPASQAGRRRFESGRPLSEEVFDSESDASGCRRISTSFAPPAYVIRLRRNNPVEGNVAPPNTAALPFLRYPCDTQLFPCWPGSHWRQSRVRIDRQSVPPLTREPARPPLQPRLRASFPGAQRDENRAWLSRRHDVAGDELSIGTIEKIAHANVGIERALRPR